MIPAITFAMQDSIGSRLIVCAACVLIGTLFILAGRNNIREKSAEETGARRVVLRLFKKDGTHKGQSAVAIGQLRIIMGVGLIIFGIVFIFVGPFLAKP